MSARLGKFFAYARHRPVVTGCFALSLLLTVASYYLAQARGGIARQHEQARKNGEFMLQALKNRTQVDADLAALREAMGQIEGRRFARQPDPGRNPVPPVAGGPALNLDFPARPGAQPGKSLAPIHRIVRQADRREACKLARCQDQIPLRIQSRQPVALRLRRAGIRPLGRAGPGGPLLTDGREGQHH